MKFFITLFVLFFVDDIIGKRVDVDTKIKQINHHVPYQVYIQKNNETLKTSYGCSGAIIDRLYVLTNSECINDEIRSYSIGIYTNPFFNSNGTIQGNRYKIEKIIRCKEADNDKCTNKFVILKLKKLINYSKYQQPIIMTEIYNESTFKISEIMNENKINLTNKPPIFHEINLQLKLNNSNKIDKKKWNSYIYTGSPMIYKNKIFGLFNKKIDNLSSIDYVKIYKYNNWIKKIIKKGHKENNVSQDQSVYQVLVRTLDENVLGNMELWNGVIIDSIHILTEGFCLLNSKETLVKIFSNINIPYNDAIEIGISKIIPHPDFDMKTGKNNIAILKLKERLIFSPNLQPVFLQYSELKNNDVVSLNKWIRKFYLNGFGNPVLKSQQTNIISINDDNTIDLELGKDEYIGHWSIALKDGELVGVNCLGISNKNYQCTSVLKYKDWILSTINNSKVY